MKPHLIFGAAALVLVTCLAPSRAFSSSSKDNGCVGDRVIIDGQWIKSPAPPIPRGSFSARLRLQLRSDGTVSSIAFDQRTGVAAVDEVLVGVFRKWKMGPQWKKCSVAIVPVTVVAKQ